MGFGHPTGKQVGVWLRLRDTYQGPQLIDPSTLWQRSRDELDDELRKAAPGDRVQLTRIIPHVEGAHVHEIPVLELYQVVVTAPSLTTRVWNTPGETVDDVLRYIDEMPRNP